MIEDYTIEKTIRDDGTEIATIIIVQKKSKKQAKESEPESN